jgi:hypothetical protein
MAVAVHDACRTPTARIPQLLPETPSAAAAASYPTDAEPALKTPLFSSSLRLRAGEV